MTMIWKVLGLLPFWAGTLVWAQDGSPLSALGLTTKTGKSGVVLSTPMQILVTLTILTLLPAVVMSITPFLRITVVLHFLRQALGTQSTPSNQVLLGLSLFLSLLVMQPIVSRIYKEAWEPMQKGDITTDDAVQAGAKPLKEFL